MAIKFRCPHCRQLLGISGTKAGTIVDCPACGRSVSVPGEGGVATRSAQEILPGNHPGLIDALHELTAFGIPESKTRTLPEASKPVPRKRKPPVTQVASQPSDSSATSERDVMRIIPLTSAHDAADTTSRPERVVSKPVGAPMEEDFATLVIPDLPEPDIPEEKLSKLREPTGSSLRLASKSAASRTASGSGPLPNELASALQELAATVPVKPTFEGSRRQSDSTEPQAARRSSLLPMMLILPAFAVGLLLGTFWRPRSTTIAPPPAPAADKIQAVVATPPAVGQRQLNGTVRWTNNAGASSPDAGALILLLPTVNPTRLRLDGRPLREAEDSAARNAIEAALQSLGGSVHQADDTGAWSGNVPAQAPLMMIIVSRHRSRADSQPVSPKILDAMNQWFDTPLHVIGRLAVQEQVIPTTTITADSNSTRWDVEFSSQQ